MGLKASVSLAALCIFASPYAQSSAQTPVTGTYSSVAKEARVKKALSERHGSTAEQEREAAVSIITSLADESNKFKDQTLRVRVQARAADALWESDRGLANELFSRAWEAAEKIDTEGAKATEEARKRFMTSRGGITFIPPTPNLRSEVLGLAARRDPALGEKLLARIEETKEQEEATDSGETTRPSFSDPTDPAPAIAKRLELATDLLKEGETERAKVFADPALDHATSQGIIFLCMLRQEDAGAADERYARMLALAANDPSSDATTVSLLSSYAFTPHLLVTATRRGRISNQWSDETPATEPPPGLRADFIKLAAHILLRPLPPPDQDSTSAGRAGTYFTIARLLPLFQQYMPDQVPALNARLAALVPDTPEPYKNNENGMLTMGIVPEDLGNDDLSKILAQLPDSVGGERDLIYVRAIRAGAIKGDERIREFADQIENDDLRKWARSFVDFVAVRKAFERKDAEAGVRIIRSGNLPMIQRVWGYSEAARLLKKSDPYRAMQLLDDAAAEARAIKEGEPDRVRAFACIASQLFGLDRGRTWEMVDDVVKASNAATEFSGEDGTITAQLRVRDVIAMVNLSTPSLTLASLFELLAKEDFQRARSEANGLKGDAPRATADLSIAMAVLKRQRAN